MFSKLGLVRPTIYRLCTDKVISCLGHLDTSVWRNHSFSFYAKPPSTGSDVENCQFLHDVGPGVWLKEIASSKASAMLGWLQLNIAYVYGSIS